MSPLARKRRSRSACWQSPQICLSGLAVLLWPAFASAGDYVLNRHSLDAGGGHASGGDYALTGTAAQPEAQPVAQGGAYRLQGGFWVAAPVALGDALFADDFED